MHKRARIIGPILLLALLAGGGYWWWNQSASANGASTLSGSGTIEAEDVLITSEVSGRVQSLLVDEGQEVTAGQTLAKLDPALLEAQRDQAAAAVAVAEANLALLKSGSRPEDVAAAQGAVDQARAARNGAAQAYQNALKALKNPQLLDAQVIQAQAARDSAQRALAQVQARYALATSNWSYVQDSGNDPIAPKISDGKGGTKPNKLSDAQRENYYSQFVQAEAALHQAEQAVELSQVAADAARQGEVTGIQTAESQAQAAEATLAKLRNGATKENLAIARTNLANAQRALDQAQSMRGDPQQLQAAA